MKISVIVPAYRRPKLLVNCLNSLKNQSRKPDKIYITAQENDIEVMNAVNEWKKDLWTDIAFEFIVVNRPGQSYAMNQAIKKIKEGIVCFIDDDAEAERDWVEKIERWYKDPLVGGVGGFVFQHSEGTIDTGTTEIVGKITWFGKVIGLHHYKVSGVREVSFLKGCNMSFRRECLPLSDENLTYEQFYDEVDVGLTVKERGYKLVFDPEIRVTHYDSPQFYIAKRRELKPKRVWSNNFNYIYVMLKHFRFPRILAILIYAFFFMRSSYSGFIPFFILKMKKKNLTYDILWASLQGKLSGINAYIRWRKDFIK